MEQKPETAGQYPAEVVSEKGRREELRAIANETAIAMSYAGSTHAVLMATPDDLVDFAYGFSLTEGIVGSPEEIVDVEVVPLSRGIDVQISLVEDRSAALAARRRSMAGPVGCGLCGLESLEAAMRTVPVISENPFSIRADEVNQAVNALNAAQPLFSMTRAVHGAGLFVPGQGLAAVREDVGRHNALDKLIGNAVREATNLGAGALVLTSRLSVEMVQKAAIAGSPVLISISAPTALAIETAEEAGITIVATARGDGFTVYTHGGRVIV